MSILKQKTLKQPIKFSGVGLHSGKKVDITATVIKALGTTK